MRRTHSNPTFLGCLLLAAVTAFPGCGKDEPEAEIKSQTGVIERIDREESRLTLRFYNPKHDREDTVTGTINADTEIFINGVVSSLKDLREGERVTVQGRIQRQKGELEVLALKIQAERGETIRRGTAAPGPSTQPAGETTETP